MIKHRDDEADWSADMRVDLSGASDLQSLLETLMKRYQLVGGVIANNAGTILAQCGGDVQDLQTLAAAIDVSVLPRYYANGPFDAYVDVVAADKIALLMRARPDAGEGRTELGMVSDYQVAKTMMEELRGGIHRLT